MAENAYQPVSARENEIGRAVVDAAFAIHKELGPGLLESVYEACFCYEMTKRGLPFSRQVEVPIHYGGVAIDAGFRLDVLVDDLVVCELKAVEGMNPVYMAQLLTYLKLTKKRLGFLINFNSPLIKHGIRRVII